MNYSRFFCTLALSLGLGLMACGPEPTPNNPIPSSQPPIEVPQSTLPANQRSYFAIYMVGGDLEDDAQPRNGKADEAESGKQSQAGSGSDDLKELVKGYSALSNTEKQRLDVLVAFGGARKQGWQGVKYADMSCLVRDSYDGYFGNDSCYLKKDERANMASGQALSEFLTWVQTKSQNHSKKILDMWNHGVDYLGTGVDTTQNGDLIQLSEFKTALENAKLKVDMVGFDACLMGSLEVAQVIKNHARYMVASEELEPGHGWNYNDIITHLGKKPQASLVDFGRYLVDSFIDHPTHQKRKNKTLSLVDLQAIDPVVQAVDQIVAQLEVEQFQRLLKALEGSQRYGVQSKDEIVFSVDLLHFAENLVKQGQLDEAQALENAFKQAVLYNRHDPTKSNSHGLSVYSLNKKLKPAYGSKESFSPAWLTFADNFVSSGSADNQDPVLKPVTNFYTQQESSDFIAECEVDGEAGHCFEITDNLGLERVSVIFGLTLSDERIVELGEDELGSLDDDYTQFFVPEWDRYWYQICNGPCDETDERVFAPAYFEYETEEGHYIYTAEIDFNDENAMLYLEVSAEDDEVIDEWIVPYKLDEEGYPIHSRLQFDIEDGDELVFYFLVYDPETDEETWEPLKEISFDDEPDWTYMGLTDSLNYFVAAEDYNGNVIYSDLIELPGLELEEEEVE